MLTCSDPIAAAPIPHLGCLCHTALVREVTRRLSQPPSRRRFMGGLAAAAAAGLPGPGRAAVPAAPDGPVLLTNIRLFDGRSAALKSGLRVLIDGQRIAAVIAGDEKVAAARRSIDCGGRVLMPGLIDAHWHTMLAALPLQTAMTADIGYLYLLAAAEAERTLLRGFTTVRDMGGPAFALKRAIDEGVTPGPRIFPSGAMISQTGGHGEFRSRAEIPRTAASGLSPIEATGTAIIADGPDEVLRRTREALMLGASQVKLMAGGGVSSLYDPLDVTQFLPEEISAAVRAAEDWGTYVTVHVYTPRAMQRAINAGVRCVEHGQLADEATARMIADKGVWWSLQPFLQDADATVYADQFSQQKQKQVSLGTDAAYGMAKAHKVRTGWGTDILFSPAGTHTQGRQLAKLVRWYSPSELLVMATGDNADLLALSGPRAPYDGRLGVIEPGAFADLLIVDGDPTRDATLLADPERNFRVIMKDGRIYKNTMA